MAKRKRGFTDAKYKKWLKEGRGQGSGSSYKPWILIQDVPSEGKVSRIHGIKTDRQHDFLSSNELRYFYLLEYYDDVIDIMEQYPLLSREETEIIADEMCVNHPADPNTGVNIVMTCDFLIKVKIDGEEKCIARTIKEIEDLKDRRTIEKLEIERRYWAKKDIDWGIVTEKDIDKVVAHNIEVIHPFYYLEGLQGFESLREDQIKNLSRILIDNICGDKVVISDIAKKFDEMMLLMPGTGIKLYKHLLMTRLVYIDLTKPLNFDIPVRVTKGRSAE